MENNNILILQSGENSLFSLMHLSKFIAELIIADQPATLWQLYNFFVSYFSRNPSPPPFFFSVYTTTASEKKSVELELVSTYLR